MDAHILRAVSRVRTVFLLSRLLRELFRRETLRDERRFAAHGLVHAAAVVSQLVPAALPLRLRALPFGFTLTFEQPLRGRALPAVPRGGWRAGDFEPPQFWG